MPDGLSLTSRSKSVRLGDVAAFVRGVTFKPTDVIPFDEPGAVWCFRTKNVQAELDTSDIWALSPGLVRRKDQITKIGDILVSSANSWHLIGKCCWIPDLPSSATFGGFVTVLRAIPDKVNPRYLYRWFSSEKTQHTVRGFGRQTTNISNLDLGRCLDLRIDLPSLPEQRRIAAILDGADALRAKRRAVLARLDEMAQAIFVEMFGDPTTNPKGWPIREAREIGRVVTGNTPSRAVAENYGSKVEWIKSDNLGTSSYYATQADEHLSAAGMKLGRMAPAGAVLVTCIAGSPSVIGNSAMLNRETAFNQQINALIPTEINPHFAYAYLKVGKSLVQAESTASMKGMVSKSRFERVPFMVPPRPMQDNFAHQILRILDIRSKAVAAYTAAEALVASLQHRAFTGAL